MTIDELKAGFTRLAEPVVPREDPYGRLLRRFRRTRRVRLAGWTSAAAAGIATALAVPLLAQGVSAPAPSPTVNADGVYLGTDGVYHAAVPVWIQRLLDTPTRGSLAHDKAFIGALTGAVQPGMFGVAADMRDKTVLFAGDVGTYRVALVAFTPGSRQMGVWLIGNAGTTAAQLASAAVDPGAVLGPSTGTDIGGTGGPSPPDRPLALVVELAPYSETAVARMAANRYLAVGLAPKGCQVAVNATSNPTQWRDEPTGDYLVRTDAGTLSNTTSVRVTCAGVVRHQGMIGGQGQTVIDPTPSEQQLDAALAGIRGTPPDRDLARQELTTLLGRPRSQDNCRLLYFGRVPGAPAAEFPILVAGCITRLGNTMLDVELVSGESEGWVSGVKLTDPHAIIAVRGIRDVPAGGTGTSDSVHVLVLAPRTATRLQVVAGSTVLSSSALVNGVGSVTVPVDATVQVRALDRTGAVVGSGTAPTPSEAIPGEEFSFEQPPADNWS